MGEDLNLTDKLNLLEQESRLLEISRDERVKLNSKVEDLSNEFLDQLETSNTYSTSKPVKSPFKISGNAQEFGGILEVIDKEVFSHGLKAASGGHLGYIPGGGLYASSLGDYIAAFSNEYAGMYFGSPGAVEVEEACLDWLKELFGFPEESIGNLTSGGSIANLIALTSARDAKGVLDQPVEQSVIYMTEQVHHCIHKALRIIGLVKVTVRTVEMDDVGRMSTNHIEQLIESDKKQGLTPFLIIGSAGTTDMGAVDPLNELSNLAVENNMWFHVDAAYGGFFKLLPEQKEKFKGIEKADSLVMDPHKGLFLPYGLGAVLVKDKEAVFQSHHYTANYMQDATTGDVPISPADVSPELTKHFRSLRMWLPLKLHGIKPFKAALEEKIVLTHYFRQEIVKHGFDVGPEPDLSVTYFWYPKEKNENEFNRELLRLCHEDGRVFLSSTLIGDRFVFRMAILSFRTHKSTIDSAIAMLNEQIIKVRG